MQWLIDLKDSYSDPIDLWRLRIKVPKNGVILYGRWWFPSKFKKHTERLWLEKQKRLLESNRKIALASEYLWVFKWLLPFVEVVGISGSASSLAAKPTDDIDFFVVCQPRRLALTRFSDWVIFNLLGRRRNRLTNPSKYTDRFCFNYYVTTDNLEIKPANDRNALELAELVIIFDRHQNGYYKLLKDNAWVRKWLPEWYTQGLKLTSSSPHMGNRSIFSPALDLLDSWLGYWQQRKISNQKKYRKHLQELKFWPEKR